jgi:hypothetical protein
VNLKATNITASYLQHLSAQVSIMATLDDTAYTPGKEPSRDLSLHFVTHELPAATRKTLADAGIRTVALMAAMGADDKETMENLKVIMGDWPTGVEGVMLGCKLKAVHIDCKSAQKVQTEEQTKTLEDPEKVPSIKEPDWNQMVGHFKTGHPEILWNEAIEPNRTFVEIIRRDYLKHGKVLNYSVNQIWVRADGVVGKEQQLSRTLDDLLKVTSAFKMVAVPDVFSVLHRIRGFLYALEMLGIMPLGKETGFKYLRELDNFARRYPYLEHVVLIDRKIRTEVDERIREDSNLKWPKVFEDVLKECRDFWATVPCEVLNDRRLPGTDGPKKRERSTTPEKGENSVRKERNALAKERKKMAKAKEALAKEQQDGGNPPPPPPGKGKGKGKKDKEKKEEPAGAVSRVPEAEWTAIQAFGTTRDGKKVCAFYNCTRGCSHQVCRFEHWCVKCGGKTHGLSTCTAS